MKRKLTIFFLLLALLVGCADNVDSTPLPDDTSDTPVHDENWEDAGTAANAEGDTIEIKERLFIAQTNDIYLNGADYMGRTIKYEGIFKKQTYYALDLTVYYVIRYGPGCCGYDGEAGFEVTWAGDWPKEDDWCEAVGVLEEYERDGLRFLRLNLTSLTVLEKAGAKYVNT